MSKHYLDRHEFHSELAKCKKQDELTHKALGMFELLSKRVSDDFYFNCDYDKDDAVSNSMHDLFKYWRNFKESNVVQLQFKRNFVDGEVLIVDIYGLDPILLKSSKDVHDPERRIFKIGSKVNETLNNIADVAKEQDPDKIEVFIDRIKWKVTLMDRFNDDDLSLRSMIHCPTSTHKMAKVKEKRSGRTKYRFEDIDTYNSDHEHTIEQVPLVDMSQSSGGTFQFKSPPNAFDYFTSVVRSAILKSINKINPKQLRNGVKVSIEGVNEDKGMHNV